MNIINQQYLRAALSYNATTGVLTWRERPREHFETARNWNGCNTRYAGNAAGSVSNDGYLVINIGGKLYQAHRLIWLMQTGSWPKEQIDHKNHDRLDHRWSNLREVSNAENARNRSMHHDNKSGVTGVIWYKDRTKWRAYIRVDGKLKNLGYFEDITDAKAARKCANLKYNFHKNHGKRLIKLLEPIARVAT